MSKNNAVLEKIAADQLQHNSRLKECDEELVNFIGETIDWKINSELAVSPIRHGISYLDALCSVKFENLGRIDRKKIVEVMEMVLKKTNELMSEAKQGLESEN